MTKVELYEQIRRCYYHEHLSINKIAKHFHVHKRTVHQALDSAIPPARKYLKHNTTVITPEIESTIKEWLLQDTNAPKKQKHTSRRIFQRLVKEHNYQGTEPTLRKNIGRYRRELNLKADVFVPLIHEPGEEADVDWYEAVVNFPWGQEKVQVFQMRACYSGKEFHKAFPHQTQQAFFEGHIEAFNYYCGIFKKIKYDNLRSAVNKVLQGRIRKEQENFIKLRSHYLFQSVFCLPGIRGAHEKGGVECAVGRFRRQYFVPVPSFNDYFELNDYLLAACVADTQRIIRGRQSSIESEWKQEISHLLELPKYLFSNEEIKTCIVNKKSLVCLCQNYYSVPTQYVGFKVEARLSALKVKLHQSGKRISEHVRCYGKNKTLANLDHYLELLKLKPRALRGSLPLKQARIQNHWHRVFDALWQVFIDREGESSGTRSFIDVLFLSRRYSMDALANACEKAIEYGAINASAIEYMINHAQLSIQHIIKLPIELQKYDHPTRGLNEYDQLITITEGK